MIRVYLDNCCYNRPYDDQTQLRISLESQAKLYIQELIRENKLELATSFILRFENTRNPSQRKREAIETFLQDHSDVTIDNSYAEEAQLLSREIEATGVKSADATHTACAIIAHCDYLITTDDRLLKYESDKIQVVNPMEFIRIIQADDEKNEKTEKNDQHSDEVPEEPNKDSEKDPLKSEDPATENLTNDNSETENPDGNTNGGEGE